MVRVLRRAGRSARVVARRRSLADWRARRSCRRPPMARGHVTRPAPALLFTNNNNRAGGAASTAATRYELRTAVVAFGGIQFGIRSSFDLFFGAFASAFYRSSRNLATAWLHFSFPIRRNWYEQFPLHSFNFICVRCNSSNSFIEFVCVVPKYSVVMTF